MKDDNYWIVPVFFIAVFVIVLILMGGASLERDRIYDNCLDRNQELSHKEAVKLCTELVK